ncbi:MAG: thioredoxin domain-containing protein [Actinobacteria bacterium]|nr:thioredoxin domain-containing protein [Actinomycetota bacterium]
MKNQKANFLISEKSPYLLQHAYNPVNWFPWADNAFQKAKKEDKPVFLSIGYSTCHWCHVMETESFEDQEVAKLLNSIFIPIKVDREERPDIDKVYMDFCQMLTGSGGWPLTIIMTPDKKPFFAATYIPKHNKYGRTGLMELGRHIGQLWKISRQEVLESAENIKKHYLETYSIEKQKSRAGQKPENPNYAGKSDNSITSLKAGCKDISPGPEAGLIPLFDLAFEQLSQLYDITNGGFGHAPKFPTMHRACFLMRYYKRNDNQYLLRMIENTLDSMRNGGIYDHIGFGFHRYSTDEKWLVPHFEKMLYDQAIAATGYIEAYQLTGKKKYKKTAEEIFTYLLRDMKSAEGGFYSAEDADSEGQEGKFYTWTKKEIKKLLSDKEYEIIADVFNLNGIPASPEGIIFHTVKPLKEIASAHNISLEELESIISRARIKLFWQREKRVRPFKDDKILTDWNGLVIYAFASAARAFENKMYRKAAEDAANFIIKKMFTKEKSLLHRYRDAQPAIDAYLDDYAFFIYGLIELYQATFNLSYISTAEKLSNYILDNFWDKNHKGFYYSKTGSELEQFSKKDIYDGATPSGNSIALLNFLKLAKITADPLYDEIAHQLSNAFLNEIEKQPQYYTQFLSSYDFMAGPSYEVVVVGDPYLQNTEKIIKTLNSVFLPHMVIILKPPDSDAEYDILPDYIKNIKAVNNKPTIYVCSDFCCKEPTNDIDVMLGLLNIQPSS